MRKHLLESFDKIYILDLHGNAKKKEVAPDGSPDQNVFDIMQGVSINIFVKTGKKKKNELGEVFHCDLQGKREFKYDFLNENSLKSFKWNKLDYKEPNFFFVKKDFDGENEYDKGFKIGDLFPLNVTGIKTHDDGNLVSFNKFIENNYKYDYRPFDTRFIEYNLKKVVRPRYSVMKHMLKENISLIIPRQVVTDNWNHIQVSKNLSDNRIHYSNKGIPIVCPLYLYPETTSQQSLHDNTERTPNLNPEIVKQIADGLGLFYNPNPKNLFETGKDIILKATQKTPNSVAPKSSHSLLNPVDILDYIYAVLHSPTYREKYKEFLKIDFPRVPYPKDLTTFRKLSNLGSELRQIHLLESETVENYITEYPEDGDNVVVKPRYEINPVRVLNSDRVVGKVHINETQYFDNVPEVTWNFYIGGYQPAQKWLKDRKGRELSYEDILHFQKIIVALSETDRIMKEIDTVEI